MKSFGLFQGEVIGNCWLHLHSDLLFQIFAKFLFEFYDQNDNEDEKYRSDDDGDHVVYCYIQDF